MNQLERLDLSAVDFATEQLEGKFGVTYIISIGICTGLNSGLLRFNRCGVCN